MDLTELDQMVNKLQPHLKVDQIIDELRTYESFNGFCQALDQTEGDNEDAINKSKLRLIMNKVNGTESQMFFINLLLTAGFDGAAQLYGSDYGYNLTDVINLDSCDPKNGYKQTYSLDILKESEVEDFKIHIENDGKEKRSDSKSNMYRLNNKTRGYCVIVINYFTIGTFIEMQRFRNIFHHLKYEVIMRKNLSAKELLNLMRSISKDKKLREHDHFMFMYLGHGEENGQILGFDNRPLAINELIKLFIDTECPQLKRKPRMFIINCCRGVNQLDGKKFVGHTKPHSQIIIPQHKDFFVCYSTLDGYVAQVHAKEGTKYGKALADSFVENVRYKDLNTIVIKAHDKVTNDEYQIQPFNWTQGSTRRVFFMPPQPENQ